QAAAEQGPLLFVGRLRAGVANQGQGVFGQIRGDARVDELDLARLALERRIQAPAEHVEVAIAGRVAALRAAGQLGKKAVAVGQLVDQQAPLGDDLAHLPLAAAVEQFEALLIPAPFTGQALEQQALPALGPAPAGGAADLLVDLQVQAATYQLQALVITARCEVFLQAAIDHDVGVELVERQAPLEDRLLEAQDRKSTRLNSS